MYKRYLLIHNASCYSLWWLIWFTYFFPLLFQTSQTDFLFSLVSILVFIWDRFEAMYVEKWGGDVTFITIGLWYISGRRDALSTWFVIPRSAVPFRTLILFQRDEAVYYYSAEVILDLMCPHAKNNAPTMPWITHGHCSTLSICTPPALGKRAHSHCPRLQALTSIIAVNVRICLHLCNSLMCTPIPGVVCINCGWIGLKGHFKKTRWGCQEKTREWKEGGLCQVLTDFKESFKKLNSHMISLALFLSSWSVFFSISIYCDEVWRPWYQCFFSF